MIRVCMLLHNFEPPFGGPERQAIQIATCLRDRGHQVIIVAKGTGRAPAHEVYEGLPVYRLNTPGLASLEAVYRLWRLRDSFDVIHVHGVGRLASAAVNFARRFHKRVYVKVTTAGHIIKQLPPGPRGWLKGLSPFRRQRAKLLQHADGMIAISEEIKAELARYGFPGDKIFYISNGVDTRRFHPVAPAEKLALRNKLGLPPDKAMVIFTGKITRRKGVDTLLRAWRQAAVHDRAVLVLAGSGHGQPDSMEEWLDRFIIENGLAASVIRPGAVADVAPYLAASDCFVFPSRREGLPNSLLEAMASGLLCIASDIGGNRDLILPEQTGVLLPVADIDAWAAAMCSAVRNPRPALGAAAAAFINANYCLDVTVDRLERLFTKSQKG